MRKQYKKGHDLRMPKLWVFKLHSLHTHTHAVEMKNPGKDPNPAHFFLGNKNI